MLVTLFGIVTLVRPEQPEKAELPMLVTPLGITTLVRPGHRLNALSPILMTLLGIIVLLHPITRVLDDVSMIALQLFLLSYFVLPFSTTMLVRPEQP